jgi:hypothetical protein
MTHVCRVVRFHLARFKLIRISATLSDMTDTCSLQSFHRSASSLWLYENCDDDVDHLVVKAC